MNNDWYDMLMRQYSALGQRQPSIVQAPAMPPRPAAGGAAGSDTNHLVLSALAKYATQPRGPTGGENGGASGGNIVPNSGGVPDSMLNQTPYGAPPPEIVHGPTPPAGGAGAGAGGGLLGAFGKIAGLGAIGDLGIGEKLGNKLLFGSSQGLAPSGAAPTTPPRTGGAPGGITGASAGNAGMGSFLPAIQSAFGEPALGAGTEAATAAGGAAADALPAAAGAATGAAEGATGAASAGASILEILKAIATLF